MSKRILSSADAEKLRKAQVAAIAKRLQQGKPITAAQQKFLDGETAEKKAEPPKEKLYSVNELSKITTRDRRTLDKLLVKVAPAAKKSGRNLYRMADVEAALAAKPDKTLKDDKLAEEIRKLRLANDAKEGKLIQRELVNRTIQGTTGEMIRLLSQKLENEFPALCVGLDIPGIRTKGKQLLDLIMAEWRKLVEAWPE